MRVRKPVMHLVKHLGLVAVSSALVASSCGGSSGGDSTSLPDDFNPDSVDTAGKEDSVFSPTDKGEIKLCDHLANHIDGDSGFHQYTFEGRQGWRVYFELSTDAWDKWSDQPFFWPYLRVTSPSGEKRSDGTMEVTYSDELYVSVAWTLPEDGRYTILVTSVGNMAFLGGLIGHMPGSAGTYELEIHTVMRCNSAQDCPSFLECRPDLGGWDDEHPSYCTKCYAGSRECDGDGCLPPPAAVSAGEGQ